MFVEFIWIKSTKLNSKLLKVQHSISNIWVSSNLMLSDFWFLCEENTCATVLIYSDRFLWMTQTNKRFLQFLVFRKFTRDTKQLIGKFNFTWKAEELCECFRAAHFRLSFSTPDTWKTVTVLGHLALVNASTLRLKVEMTKSYLGFNYNTYFLLSMKDKPWSSLNTPVQGKKKATQLHQKLLLFKIEMQNKIYKKCSQ